MLKKYLTNNTKETQEVAKLFAKEILKRGPQKRAVIVALQGNLGSGKTTFLQGFAKGLHIKEKVLSPTFVIQKRFSLNAKKFSYFYHLDCYRLGTRSDAAVLNIKELVENPANIIAIEWPENVRGLPKDMHQVTLLHKGEHSREILFKT